MVVIAAMVVIAECDGGGGVFGVDAWERAYVVALMDSASGLSLQKDPGGTGPTHTPAPDSLTGHRT